MSPTRGQYLISDEQLEAALGLLASGATVVSVAKQLNLSLAGLHHALATRTQYKSRNRKRVPGGRRGFWVRIDPDVFAAMRQLAMGESMTDLELVEEALRQYLHGE